MNRLAIKCEKDEKAEKKKIKKAMEKGNIEGARIHAENSIRQKNQGVNFLRMSARVDAVSQRVQTAVTMRQVTQSMKGVVASMDKVGGWKQPIHTYTHPTTHPTTHAPNDTHFNYSIRDFLFDDV